MDLIAFGRRLQSNSADLPSGMWLHHPNTYPSIMRIRLGFRCRSPSILQYWAPTRLFRNNPFHSWHATPDAYHALREPHTTIVLSQEIAAIQNHNLVIATYHPRRKLYPKISENLFSGHVTRSCNLFYMIGSVQNDLNKLTSTLHHQYRATLADYMES